MVCNGRRCLLFVLFIVILMGGCKTMESCGVPAGSPYRNPAELERGEIIHVPTGLSVSEAEFFDLTAGNRLFYIGEAHDNIYDHRLELKIIRELQRRFPGRLAVGMEMLGRQSQEEIDRWLAGELDEKAFLEVFGRDWGVLDFPYYRELLEFIRSNHIPLLAINVSKAERMSLVQERRELLGGSYPEPDDPYQKEALAAMFSGHDHGHLELFYAMQLLWEETMAESLVSYLDSDAGRDKKMVVITGGFHSAYGFGVPRKVLRQCKWPYVIVASTTPAALVENERQLMEVDFPSLPLYVADYLWCVPYRNLKDDQVRLGVHLSDLEDRVKVAAVQPDSAAARAGVQAEDLIVVIDGQPVSRSLDVQFAVLGKKAGDRCRLILSRDGQEFEVTVEFRSN